MTEEIDWLGMYLDQVGVPEEVKEKYRKLVNEKNKKLDAQETRLYEFKPMILRLLNAFMMEIEMEADRKARENPHERGRWIERKIDASIAGSWAHEALKNPIDYEEVADK